ncbi:hypothetical protein MMOR_45330 [Mycolicibacterium moriokaense]|uniref:Uncharacterized protein n=1 Tax=Mycolicibacterium moriokaense TaxID=39691 RepID=A0AAD1HDW7_9MYCO|nr:hypothetical protein MMOR_45330 [Mycolicibacterium moriokaense]
MIGVWDVGSPASVVTDVPSACAMVFKAFEKGVTTAPSKVFGFGATALDPVGDDPPGVDELPDDPFPRPAAGAFVASGALWFVVGVFVCVASGIEIACETAVFAADVADAIAVETAFVMSWTAVVSF